YYDGSTNYYQPFMIEPSTPTNTLYLNSSGKVGIGTVNPDYHLTLNGTTPEYQTIGMQSQETVNTAGRNLYLKAGKAGPLSVANPPGGVAGGNLYLYSGIARGNQGSNIYFGTVTPGTQYFPDDISPSTKMTILGNGNVGIGASSPDTKLHVMNALKVQDVGGPGGDGDADILLYANDGGKANIFQSDDSDGLFIYSSMDTIKFSKMDNNGAPIGGAKILLNGKVGIGTPNPETDLVVDDEIWICDY
ncbi:MAG: hypothetical protein ISS47_05845, partial [Candidatus Omnitrophica bacterium]|nr:hypothetical protein [Candidatus Omnitrophota bacterium]